MRVYVAGPMSRGDLAANIRQAMDAADTLLRHGHAVYVPHLFTLHQIVHPVDYDAWLRQDFEWIAVCDALVRLPGESPGADAEAEFAGRIGVRVFRGVDEFLAWAEREAAS